MEVGPFCVEAAGAEAACFGSRARRGTSTVKALDRCNRALAGSDICAPHVFRGKPGGGVGRMVTPSPFACSRHPNPPALFQFSLELKIGTVAFCVEAAGAEATRLRIESSARHLLCENFGPI